MPERIELKTTKGIDFAFHFEGQEVVIDRCDGISAEDGLRMFPYWVMQILEDNGNAKVSGS